MGCVDFSCLQLFNDGCPTNFFLEADIEPLFPEKTEVLRNQHRGYVTQGVVPDSDRIGKGRVRMPPSWYGGTAFPSGRGHDDIL